MISAWLVISWLILRGADYLRASALHRAHTLGWIYAVSWILLAMGAYGLHVIHIAGIYGFVFLNAAAFLALSISYLEFFALPTKSSFATSKIHSDDVAARSSSLEGNERPGSRQRQGADDTGTISRPGSSARRLQEEEDQQATETTSLLDHSSQQRRNSHPLQAMSLPYGDEQAWSADMPKWTWVLQFLVLAPVTIIFFGQIALLLTSATHQTPADGNPVMPIYVALAALTVILLIPVSSFLHRFPGRVIVFLFLVCIGTLIYNTTAFPFSEGNKLKIYFSQELDLDSGLNHVNLNTVKSYGRKIIDDLPSAQGQHVSCSSNDQGPRGPGLETCQWHSAMPNVVAHDYRGYNTSNYRSWVSLDAKRVNTSQDEAIFAVTGKNTRACILKFDTPVLNYTVTNASSDDPRFVKIPEGGVRELRLWSRAWDNTWQVRVSFNSPEIDGTRSSSRKLAVKRSFEGRAVCLWNDDDQVGAIPALDELKRFMPPWSIVTKAGDGLLEASKAFKI